MMMLKMFPLLLLTLVMALAMACATTDEMPAASSAAADTDVSDHMVAEATITAHYIAAALKAGMTPAEINAELGEIAGKTVISEFWISDDKGDVVFSSVPGAEFSFGTDPDADRQAAPFVNLLRGETAVVVQEAQPRDLDQAVFQYVGVAGVDGPRIVQVGFRR